MLSEFKWLDDDAVWWTWGLNYEQKSKKETKEGRKWEGVMSKMEKVYLLVHVT